MFLNVLDHFLLLTVATFGILGLIFLARRRQHAPQSVTARRRLSDPPPIPMLRPLAMSPAATRHAVVDSMSDGMIVLDHNHRVIDVNPAAQHIIERPTDEMIGKPIAQLWPTLAQQFRNALTRPVDVALGAKNRQRFYEVSISPFHGKGELIQGHLLIFRDVTERKKLEHMREDLTRTMVHDLRDPISNALFALEMLKTTLAESNSAEAQQLVDLTFASTAKTLQLVDKILEIGRLESGEMPISPSPFSLAELTQSILTAQKPRATRKQIRLVCDVPEDLPLAWADIELIERVLQNLIDNGIKFSSPQGVIKLTATAQRDTDKKVKLAVSVSDTGPGVPPNMREQIFEQFVTGPYKESGSGLGLAFCKMALIAHGQEIWIEDTMGGGATFSFTLPTNI